MAEKITYAQYLAILLDPASTDEQILAVAKVQARRHGLDFAIVPDPKKVEIPPEQAELESALGIGNNLERWRRWVRFRNRFNSGENLPVIVEEGDSWHQFPLLVKDVVDHLGKDYLIYSVSAAGDTAENMVYGPLGKGERVSGLPLAIPGQREGLPVFCRWKRHHWRRSGHREGGAARHSEAVQQQRKRCVRTYQYGCSW
ncbi:hypothetical protein [Pannonibacter phragmitetus]|uniref:hypothetical protein n=1 Tax=Pannonibacter phragmitetus TaxID=121719 RepID=UPI003D2F3C14